MITLVKVNLVRYFQCGYVEIFKHWMENNVHQTFHRKLILLTLICIIITKEALLFTTSLVSYNRNLINYCFNHDSNKYAVPTKNRFFFLF